MTTEVQEQLKTIVLPTADNIFVKRLATVTETAGGIVVPDQAQDRPSEGTIVAIGPSIWTSKRRNDELLAYTSEDRDPPRKAEDHYSFYEQTFDLGDHILFGQFAGIEVRIDDESYVKVRPDEVFCVIRKVPVTA